MKLVLHDNGKHLDFAPLTLTRPIGDLRMGILTNAERWKLLLPDYEIGFSTEEYLQGKFPDNGGVKVNACVIASEEIASALQILQPKEGIWFEDIWVAGEQDGMKRVHLSEFPLVLEKRWHLYQKNGEVLQNDFDLLTSGRTSRQLSSTNIIIGDANKIFLEEGAKVEGCTLNTNGGPIYVGKDAEIMEGSLVRGPFAMNEHAALKLGAKVYGPTTLGPHCKVGGEVNNVIFQAYSNKGHDGFLGNSVIGEWCNLGADTNCSNLKNNYDTVKTYDFRTQKVQQTDVQFMGLMMGDHSKCGINTMFNTATVVGVSANVFGADFPPKFVPSFSWGTEGGEYDFVKALESANNMMVRRGKKLTEAEVGILEFLAGERG
jgi:UDP-N-acetylglucosamine diphosphorylase/glucosamine-1-phosphate N-acetyltransferase